MPDFTDGFSADMRAAALQYADTGPTQILQEDWDQHLGRCRPARQIREIVEDMPDEALRTAYCEHLIRDASKRAVANARGQGKNAVKHFLLAEARTPGLWVPATFTFIGRGVMTVDDGDQAYDVPLRHLRIRTAAELMAATAKHKLSTWGRIAQMAGHLLDLDEEFMPADMTFASPRAPGIYEYLRGI